MLVGHRACLHDFEGGTIFKIGFYFSSHNKMVNEMRKIFRLWIFIFIIIFLWIYFLFISPKLFNKSVIIVPNLINMTEDEAIKYLIDNKFDYIISYHESSSNKVIKTIPYPNTKINLRNFKIILRKVKKYGI